MPHRLTGAAAALLAALFLPPPAAAETGSPGNVDAGTWSTEPFPLERLDLPQAKLRLKLDQVIIDGVALGPMRATALLGPGRFKLEIHEAAPFGGTATGALTLERKGESLGLALTLGAEGVETGALAAALGAALSGRADLDLALLAEGASPAALIASLAGEGRAQLSDGALAVPALAEALPLLYPPSAGVGPRIPLQRAETRLALAGGVARLTDLLVRSPALAARGSGQLDLPRRWLDLTLAPSLSPDRPLRLYGPWSALRLSTATP